METARIVVPEAEEILGKYFPVLDHGFACLKEYMGGDKTIERAARTSYEIADEVRDIKQTRHLLRYLYRKQHFGPFEQARIQVHMGLPIFVMRQWVRHRTACLAGDVRLEFDRPVGIKNNKPRLYPVTVEDVYQKFQPTRNKRTCYQGDPFLKRGRVQKMWLRQVDEDTLAVRHTHIVDIWESGVKPVYRVSLQYGSVVTMSADHRCLTESGWMTLKDIVILPSPGEKLTIDVGSAPRLATVGPGKNGIIPSFNPIDEATEGWSPVVGWEDWYQVSNQGRIRRVVGGRGSRSYGRCKRLAITAGHATVTLNRPGIQKCYLVHQLMLSAFVGPRPEGFMGCHKDGNALNNLLDNLYWGTAQQNSDDAKRLGTTQRLSSFYSSITSVEHIGDRMTYDLEVEGPHHNFSADGVIVHNSLNEYSGRYSPMPMLFYTPDPGDICYQAAENKQGRSGPVDPELAASFKYELDEGRAGIEKFYRWCLDQNIAKETARIDLPLSTYTYIYWTCDIRNLLHLIGLRSDPHAQKEIRVYSDVLAGIVKRVCPLTLDAFQDYQMDAVTMTQADLAAVRFLCSISHPSPVIWGSPPASVKEDVERYLAEEWGIRGREAGEFWGKIRTRAKRDFSLDVGSAMPASHFLDAVKKHTIEVST